MDDDGPLSLSCAAAINQTTQKWPLADWYPLYRAITRPGHWDLARLESVALQLRPWRKGPIIHDALTIDAEWDCAFKWDRLQPLLPTIVDKTVLDIGGNNGYFTRKFKSAGARYVTGIEPTFIYSMQFIAQNRWQPMAGIRTVPMTLDTIHCLAPVDIIACMGVLYYCPNPPESLEKLYQQLRPKGQLWLETLTVPDASIQPTSTFAGIRKVAIIPSTTTLIHWLHTTGFSDIQLIDSSPTLPNEQRATVWSHNHSMQPHLNRGDHKTTEGYPTPNRTLICAHKLR